MYEISHHIAYFSMELALESAMPTYAGGLGVLAGDTLRSAADLGLPMVAVSLLYRKGHFYQRLDREGRQHEEPVVWVPEDFLQRAEATVEVEVEGRVVKVAAWSYAVSGVSNSTVPVFLLDTDLPENDPYDRSLTDSLYGGDHRYRLCQEVVLGIGGLRMLRALGFDSEVSFHMNEGHSALLALELFFEELAGRPDDRDGAFERVRRKCMFTTHTPVPAGHDQFPMEVARGVLGERHIEALRSLGCCPDGLNMTLVALSLSHYVNGVTERHGRISSSMFPGYPIGSITNGVHSATWTSPPFHTLYDRHIKDWRRDSFSLRYALGIPLAEIGQAHTEAKGHLIELVNERTNLGFDTRAFTIGSARRVASYKRPTLLFHDLERLRQIAGRYGKLQLVLGGKAHPQDIEAKALIQQIVHWSEILGAQILVAFLPSYDLALAKMIIAGVDLWLNTPKPPYEASGTSGMKAAHNGVPSLSVFDGWWVEGHIEGVTGWGIGPRERGGERSDAEDAADLYRALEETILPIYHDQPEHWTEIMRATIAFNASFFNSQRMLEEYMLLAYQEQHPTEEPDASTSSGTPKGLPINLGTKRVKAGG
jgi:starch phosphorylase